ncbi:MAG: ABC transporter substrate-binding protein [archaeon]|jgi:branched-chain amino acid transport system substrate-binding protein
MGNIILGKVSIVLLAIVIISIVGIIGFNSTGFFALNNPDEIVVGGIGIFSGEMAVYGDYMRQGVLMALDEINANGGVKGKKVKVIFEDDVGDPKKAVTVAEKLISVDKVKYLIHFSGSGSALAVSPLAEANKVPMVIGVASNSKIKYAGDYTFRTAAADSQQAKQWVNLAKEKYSKPAVLFVNNSWSVGVKDAFIEYYSKNVFSESMPEGASDVRAQLYKLKEYSPDVLFLLCYIGDCISSIKQMNELDLDVPVVAGDVFVNKQVLEGVGTSAEGFLATKPADGSGKEWESFKQKFNARYGKDPDILDAEAYDMMYTLYYALNSSDFSSEGVKNALYSVNFLGPSGSNSFDSFGEVDKAFEFVQVKGSKFVPYEAN